MHGAITGDVDIDGPQKFHTKAVPRIGGLAISLGILASILLSHQGNPAQDEKFLALLCALPVFGIGIMEDLTKKASIRIRLVFTAFGALLAYLFLGAQIIRLSIPGLEFAINISIVSMIFTIFAITGLANAYNIIDGFNGLSSMIGIITLLALGYLSIKLGDVMIMFLSFTMAASILGFFLFNYPKGLIFLGDGGAYLIGFWVAVLSVLLVNRHTVISPWFALVVNAYPIIETLFTIYRRKYHQNKSPGHPDGMHFHSLIFRRILNPKHITTDLELFDANSKTSPYLWVLCSMATIPAIFFYDSTTLLITSFAIFTLSYVWIYKQIVCFKAPRWIS